MSTSTTGRSPAWASVDAHEGLAATGTDADSWWFGGRLHDGAGDLTVKAHVMSRGG